MAGRPLSATLDDILDAGRVIEMAGQRVTSTGLRKALGRGRPDVLMREWEAARTADAILAPELKAEVDTLVSDLARGIVRLVDNAMRAQTQQLMARIREADALRLEAETMLGEVAAPYEHRIAALERALTDKQRALDDLQAGWTNVDALTEVKARLVDIDKRLCELTAIPTVGRAPSTKAGKPSAAEASLGLFGPQPDRSAP